MVSSDTAWYKEYNQDLVSVSPYSLAHRYIFREKKRKKEDASFFGSFDMGAFGSVFSSFFSPRQSAQCCVRMSIEGAVS